MRGLCTKRERLQTCEALEHIVLKLHPAVHEIEIPERFQIITCIDPGPNLFRPRFANRQPPEQVRETIRLDPAYINSESCPEMSKGRRYSLNLE